MSKYQGHLYGPKKTAAASSKCGGRPKATSQVGGAKHLFSLFTSTFLKKAMPCRKPFNFRMVKTREGTARGGDTNDLLDLVQKPGYLNAAVIAIVILIV